MLGRLFRGDDTIYTLLEASAAQARQCAILLNDVIPHLGGDTSAQLEAIRVSRRQHKKLTQEITEKLCRTFVTPLDREDIEALSSSLHKIPKTVEKIAERLTLVQRSASHDFVTSQVTLLDQGTTEVVNMVNSLRRKVDLDTIQKMQDHLQHVEGDGDRVHLDLLRELYSNNFEAVEVILLKDLYELLEKAIDRCRDAGNVVFQVVLKYS